MKIKIWDECICIKPFKIGIRNDIPINIGDKFQLNIEKIGRYKFANIKIESKPEHEYGFHISKIRNCYNLI